MDDCLFTIPNAVTIIIVMIDINSILIIALDSVAHIPLQNRPEKMIDDKVLGGHDGSPECSFGNQIKREKSRFHKSGGTPLNPFNINTAGRGSDDKIPRTIHLPSFTI